MTATVPFPLTWLYAPGDRPHVVSKALASGADVVVIDLEDAVAPERKEYARAATAELLTEPPPVPVHVRVNAVDGPLAAADLAAVAPRPGLAGLRLPKVTSAQQVVRVARQTEGAGLTGWPRHPADLAGRATQGCGPGLPPACGPGPAGHGPGAPCGGPGTTGHDPGLSDYGRGLLPGGGAAFRPGAGSGPAPGFGLALPTGQDSGRPSGHGRGLLPGGGAAFRPGAGSGPAPGFGLAADEGDGFPPGARPGLPWFHGAGPTPVGGAGHAPGGGAGPSAGGGSNPLRADGSGPAPGDGSGLPPGDGPYLPSGGDAGASPGDGSGLRPDGGTGMPPGEGGPPLYALLETALAIEHAYAIASAHPSLRGISIGEADLRADLGVRQDAGLDWCRARVVVAARAAGLAPPAQSVHPDIRDLEGLAASCAHGRALGFLGRAAIHPRQLPIIERAYLPTDRELEEAETIIKAATADRGAQALADGRFVDAAVVAAAQRTLALARRC